MQIKIVKQFVSKFNGSKFQKTVSLNFDPLNYFTIYLKAMLGTKCVIYVKNAIFDAYAIQYVI